MIYNFNPGPSIVSKTVLKKYLNGCKNYANTGLSILEISHRSKDFKKLLDSTNEKIKKIYHMSDEFSIFWMSGGASRQFSNIPLNLMKDEADYVNTGIWSKKAIRVAEKVGKTNIIFSGEKENFKEIPENFFVNKNSSYVHITSNNTIYGTQFSKYKKFEIPLISDMSSDIFSKKINLNDFGMIYAGAQKNIGIAGVTVVIIRNDLIKEIKELNPLDSYYECFKKNSIYNTPPVSAIYFSKLSLDNIEKRKIENIEKENFKKAKLIYEIIDKSNLYEGFSNKKSRSLMNITFNIKNKEIEENFLKKAKNEGFIGLEGYRTIGGVRISNYNNMPFIFMKKLANFMKNFEEEEVI